jgi:MFS family permease
MTRVAMSWLVYRLTDSALMLGLVGFSGQILTFVLAPVAGVWVDRVNRHRLLLATQVASALQSLLLAGLTLTHRITIEEILVLALFQGLINAFDMPVRQSFLIRMVEDKKDLSNAIALNSSMVNLARLVGPAVAGAVIAAWGEGFCFLIDGVSYFAVIGTLLMMRVEDSGSGRPTTSMIQQLSEGWEYVLGFSPIRTILILFGIVSLTGMPYVVLMPIFAQKVLHGGAHTLGLLLGASGVGALASAITLAMRRTVRGLTGAIQRAAYLFGGSLIVLGLSRNLWLSLLMMLVSGFGMMQGLAASNTVIQTLVPEAMRGRVMSYYTIAFAGMAPFGSLLAGWLAHRMGAPNAVIVTGACCLVAAAWFSWRLRGIRAVMKPIYQEMGILAVDGMQ